MKQAVFILLCVMLTLSCQAKDPQAKDTAEKTKSTMALRGTMDEIATSFLKLLPLMTSELKFNDPKNEEAVKKHLLLIEQSFKNIEKHKKLQTPTFEVSYQTITDHIENTLENFQSGNKHLARIMLHSTSSLCMSCHTQLPPTRSAFSLKLNKVDRKTFENDFEFAEFLFLTRAYNEASELYDQIIQDKLNKINSYTNKAPRLGADAIINYSYKIIRTALQRKLSIYTKIKRSPQLGLKYFEKMASAKGLPKALQIDVESWKNQLKRWTSQKIPSSNALTNTNVRLFIENHLTPLMNKKNSIYDGSHNVTLLIASGVLSQFLNANPKSELVPEILYWLGVSDRQLHFSYFFSLADIYLKECITKYSSHPYAPKCYKEYEDYVIFASSGSSGTSISEEDKKELERLKAHLKNKAK